LLRDVVPDAPAYLEAICAKCLALAASARYASVREILTLLDTSAPTMPRRKPRWLVPAIAAGVAAAGAGTWLAWPRDRAAKPASVVPATAELASAVRSALGERLDEDERHETGLSPSLEADHEFALGRAAERVNDTDAAILHLERALATDPEFALGHDQIAYV